MRSDCASRASESVALAARSHQLQATAEASGRVSILGSIVRSDIPYLWERGRGASKRERIDGLGAEGKGPAAPRLLGTAFFAGQPATAFARRLKLRTDPQTHCENHFLNVPDAQNNVPERWNNEKTAFPRSRGFFFRLRGVF